MTARTAKRKSTVRRKARRTTRAAALPAAQAREPEKLNPGLAEEDARRDEQDDASVEDPLGDWPEPDVEADEWAREHGGRRSEESPD